MAEEEEEEEEQKALPKADSKGPYRYLFLIIVILLIETAVAYFALDWAIPAPEVVEEEAVLEELNEDVFVVPIFYEDLTEMVFSPLDTHGSQLVSLTMVLEVDRDVVLEEITKKRARIWDMALQELEGRTVAELRDPDKEAIREAVMNTINEELQNGAVTGIYITDFIMQ